MQIGFRKVVESLDRFPTRNRKNFIENEFSSYRPELPPPPFVPPFDPPGSQSPYIPEGSSTNDDSDEGDESTTASSSDDLGPRPDWWPEDWPWPPEPEEPVVLEAYPPIHTWPRLPPDHPYHVPPGYSAPDNLPPGHPGEHYPDMPPYPVVHPVQPDEESSNDGGST